jgi:hypothetical protein
MLCGIDSEPSTFEEVVEQQEWKDVWEVISRTEGKLVVTSKLIYTIKHVADRSVKQDLWLEDSPNKREKIMTRHLLQ